MEEKLAAVELRLGDAERSRGEIEKELSTKDQKKRELQEQFLKSLENREREIFFMRDVGAAEEIEFLKQHCSRSRI